MNDLKYTRILRAVAATPWAIEPSRLADIMDVLAYQAAGGKLSAEEVREYVSIKAHRTSQVLVSYVTGDAKGANWLAYGDGDTVAAAVGARPSGVGQGVAVLGLRGIISHRIEQVENISGPGGTSVEGFRSRLRAAHASSDVGAIVLDVDSPGGNVNGVPELAEEIRSMRGGDKPIVAVANAMAASAAYWIGVQADEFVVTPSGQVGSIGVFTAHEDHSAEMEAEGVKVTLIHAGKYKIEGHPFGPLSDEAREAMQADVDGFYSMFVDAVAKGRGVKSSAVRGGFGEGRTVGAREAVAEGMADRVETLDETIQRLQGRSGNRSRRRVGPVSASHFEFYPAA